MYSGDGTVVEYQYTQRMRLSRCALSSYRRDIFNVVVAKGCFNEVFWSKCLQNVKVERHYEVVQTEV